MSEGIKQPMGSFYNFFSRIGDLLLQLINKGYDKFRSIGLSEKIIFLNSIAAFFAIILPAAKFYIFESFYFINNPLAVYMIGIVMIMLFSLFFSGKIKLVVRLLLNGYYLFWAIYLPLAGELTKANPHEICFGYYLNMAVPLIYIISSICGYFITNE